MPRDAVIHLPVDFCERPEIQALSDRAFRILLHGMCVSADGESDFSALAAPATIRELERSGLIQKSGFREMWAIRPTFYQWQRKTREAVSTALRALVLLRDGCACLRCGATEDLQMDHIFPWSRGGETTADNLQTLCGPCNRAKGAKV